MSSVDGNAPAAGSSRVPLLFMGGVFLFLAAIFTGIGGSLVLTERSYRQGGVRTEALVTAKALRPATVDTGTVYEITCRFTPVEGSLHEQTNAVTVHQWERVERGSAIAVEYVRGDPASARLVPDSAEQTIVASIGLGVGVLLGLIGLGLIVSAFRRRAVVPATAPAPAPAPAFPSGDPPIDGRPTDASPSPSLWSSFGVLFGGIFLLCGLPFFVIGAYLFYDDWRFSQEARSTQGLVLTKDIRVSSGSGSNRSRTKHYEVTYRFVVGQETLEGKDELSHGQWQRLREREPVEVRYRPQRPASNHLAGRSAWLLKTIFTLLGSIFTAIGGTVLVRGLRRARLEARLRQHGVGTQGTVVAVRPRNVAINNVPQWRLAFEYRDYQGQRHEGTADMPVDEAEAWKAGDSGRVLYDREKPEQGVWRGRDG
jgi:Protein of unknown function (DUF3592)